MSFTSRRVSPRLYVAFLLAPLSAGCDHLFGVDGDYRVGATSGGAGGAASATSSSAPASASTGSGASATGSGGGGETSVLIDDMEDGSLSVTLPLRSDGSAAHWYISTDKTGTITSPPANASSSALIQLLQPPRGDSLRGVHLAGKDFVSFGADAGLWLDHWDVSGFKGVQFWARTDTPTCLYALIVQDINTDPNGGICTKCYDGFAKQLAYTTEWTQYTVSFASLRSAGWGLPPQDSLETKGLMTFYFRALPSCAFDMWIDDLTLYR